MFIGSLRTAVLVASPPPNLEGRPLSGVPVRYWYASPGGYFLWHWVNSLGGPLFGPLVLYLSGILALVLSRGHRLARYTCG